MATASEIWSINICSSTYGGPGTQQTRCDNALDGNTGTDWASYGALDGVPSLSFQLTSPNAPAVTLLGVMWYTRNTAAACERVTGMKVVTDGGTTDAAPSISAAGGSACAAPGWLTAYLATPVSTRYVGLVLATNCAGAFTHDGSTTQSATCNAGFAEVRFIVSA
jgi:hypothetical protein